ncbi:MAG: hypothetical protein KC588_16615 [Nitrospira sp.]|nr:hypothetical protein [Nitrospira sp.]
MENAYAFAGHRNNNFWPLSDYGNITLNELKEKPFSWFVDQAKKKRDRPKSIMARFRESFPEVARLEPQNGLNVNLCLAIVLIELLRHVIVHDGGVVPDKSKFMKTVLEKANLFNNGNPADKYTSFISSYFGNEKFENTVSILEVRVRSEIPFDVHVNLFDILSGYLMAYAHLIFELLEENLHKNLIQRKMQDANAD